MGLEGDKGPPYKFGMGPPEGLIRPCMDKMIYGQNGTGQNGMEKMMRKKWRGQNGNNFFHRF